MRLSQFEYMIALKEYGSFSKAAQVLFISQPSLSAAMKELEAELGFEILYRSRRGVTFTPQGELVLKEAVIIMDAVKRIKKIEYQEIDSIKGKLRVGGIPYFCDVLLVDSLMKLQKRHPNLSVQIVEDDSDHLLKLVAEENLDVAIILTSYLDEKDKRNELIKIKVNYHRLFDDEMVFVAREGHPLLEKGCHSIECALEYPYITHRKTPSPITQRIIQSFGDANNTVYVSGLHNLYKYIVHSDAISAFPKKSLSKMFEISERLKVVPIKDFIWKCEVGWIAKESVLGPAEELFVQQLEELCGNLALDK